MMGPPDPGAERQHSGYRQSIDVREASNRALTFITRFAAAA
jgi:hypothetical protein